ncbi:MAG: TrmO family methyltransferase [Geothrix sp.]|nr:TrmO family methyltransferase [Geothrix sp.]
MDRTPVPTVAFTIRPIGLVHAAPRKRARISKYFIPKGRATLELFHPYLPGLQGLYSGLEIWVITYHAPSGRIPTDACQGGDGGPGVFATSSVERPNPIEFLRARVVELDSERGLIDVEGLDIEDGAPILDIRPAMSPHHRLAKPGE